MKNVLISGYYGFNNTGDEAMIETMSSLLAKKNYGLIVLSSNPERTKELYNVQAYDRYKISEVKKAIKNSDMIVSGGGTLFQDITSRKSILYYLGIIKLAQMQHKKICIAYQGMGPLASSFNRIITKNILNKKSVKLIALRDDQAIDFAKEIGIDKGKIIFSSDMIFMLEPPPKERCNKILRDNVHGYKEGQKLIGISIREWKDKDRTDLFAELADKLVEAYDARIVFFPFHKPKDAEISKIVMHKMKHEEAAVLMPNRYLPSEILGTMGLMDINIGVRLHSLVFSAVMNVPTVGISYDPKIDGFLDTIDMKSICTYDNIDIDKILKEVRRLLEDDKVDYSEKIDYFKRIGIETLDRILNELEK
ncbi:MAG: polysaccharide pyruvyl transferase CsaB [Clostridia bacterium]|nr:polysaccharide pyruvyl transferase CsaB [Clostridia bacterium]